jgi:aryl-alcohol dehydrogenase
MISMRAAVVNEAGGTFEIEEVTLEQPRTGEVLVRLVATGVCHTDLSMRNGVQSPQVLGHEGAGIVESVGAGVTGLAPGDKVVLSFASCGDCDKCQGGSPAHCRQFVPLNMFGTRADGSRSIRGADGREIGGNFFGQSSFAEYALATPRNIVRLPADTPGELLCLLGPLGCGIQTGAGGVINSLQVRAGSSIAIFGAGGVGLSALLAAVVSGCSTIVVIDVNPARLDLALELGATHVVDARDEDARAQIIEATGGGADYSVETSGNVHAVRNAVEVLDVGGTAGLIGLGRPGSEIVLDHSVMGFGRRLVGIVEGDAVPQDFIPALIALHRAGKFAFDRFVRTYPFEDIQQAVDDSLAGTTVKGIVVF